MFCDHCGTPLQADSSVCPQCGKAINPAGGAFGKTRFERHLHLLGVFWIAAGAVCLIPSFVLMTVAHSIPFVVHQRAAFGHMFFPAHVFFLPFMVALSGGFLLLAAGGICVGWGLMHREPWARVAAIVLAVLVLIHPPFGTALGIFTLWVLLSHDAAWRYDQLARTR